MKNRPLIKIRRRALLQKYGLVFASLISGSLLASGLLGMYFSYYEQQRALIVLQQAKADHAAEKIAHSLFDIEQDIATTTPNLQNTDPMSHRLNEINHLRSIGTIEHLILLDQFGKEKLRTSRLGSDQINSGRDLSQEDFFRQVKSGKPYRSQVSYGNELSITVAMAVGPEAAGITVAQINLEFLFNDVKNITVGQAGTTYAVDAAGMLIAHPNLNLVLKKTNLAGLPQVQAARQKKTVTQARDLNGETVLSTYSEIPLLGWLVFVEQPKAQAYAGVYQSLRRLGFLLLFGIILAIVSSMIVVHKMMVPILAIKEGATRIGSGSLEQRIEVKTGDELEELAEQFNRMASQLRDSYANLEQKIELRTRELVNAQQQLVFQEKMASLGTLTAGVAHEINNPANFAHVGAFNLKTELRQFHEYLLQLAGEDAPPELINSLQQRIHTLNTHLATISEGTVRIRDLVKDLRTFARTDEAESKTMSIAENLQSTVNLVKMQYLESTTIVCQLDANPIIECWPAQLNQVFMNLIVNACQAIQNRQTRQPGPGFLHIRSKIEAHWLMIDFEDNGIGMSPATQARVFEPFFTTKTVGDGMGMGLSISFGIIQKHQGALDLRSQEGQGSCFTVKLPLPTNKEQA